MDFDSQICTSRSQSERLLALGLKKETADCQHCAYTKDSKGNQIPKRNQKWFTRIGTEESVQVCGFMDATFIPAWSLHRLIEMMPNRFRVCDRFAFLIVSNEKVQHYLYDVEYDDLEGVCHWGSGNIYDNIIDCIRWLIGAGYFNKEYLEE